MFERFREIRERRAREDQGFTLIELLIVIAVIAILAAIVIFGLSGVQSQSAQSSCKSDAKSVEVALEAYKAATGAYPGAIGDPGTGNTVLVTSTPSYLRTYPNSTHYAITTDAAGIVYAGPSGAGVNFDTETATTGCNAVK